LEIAVVSTGRYKLQKIKALHRVDKDVDGRPPISTFFEYSRAVLTV